MVARYSVEAVHFATQDVPGPQALWMRGWGSWVRFNYYAFLVRGEGRVALVDCGIDDLQAFNAMNRAALGERGLVWPTRREGRLLDALAARGLRSEDIDTVAFTHFHADHVANARLFPRARFLVSAPGWRRFESVCREVPQMVPDPLFPADVIRYLGDVLDERMDLVEDGVTPLPGIDIKHVGGHTVESAAFVIETSAGSVVIPGDTIWLYQNLEQDVPVGSNVDVAACFGAMLWARHAGDVVIPTHDPDVLVRHPKGVIAR